MVLVRLTGFLDLKCDALMIFRNNDIHQNRKPFGVLCATTIRMLVPHILFTHIASELRCESCHFSYLVEAFMYII